MSSWGCTSLSLVAAYENSAIGRPSCTWCVVLCLGGLAHTFVCAYFPNNNQERGCLTCNILLVPRCFCIVVLQSASLNFGCAWLSGRGVVAKITSVVCNRNLTFDGNLRRRTCIVHDCICLSDKAVRLTCKYASASLFIFVLRYPKSERTDA